MEKEEKTKTSQEEFYAGFDAWRIPLGLESTYDNAAKYCTHLNRLIMLATLRETRCTTCPTCEQTLPAHLQNNVPSLATQKVSSVSGEFSASSPELTKV